MIDYDAQAQRLKLATADGRTVFRSLEDTIDLLRSVESPADLERIFGVQRARHFAGDKS